MREKKVYPKINYFPNIFTIFFKKKDGKMTLFIF